MLRSAWGFIVYQNWKMHLRRYQLLWLWNSMLFFLNNRIFRRRLFFSSFKCVFPSNCCCNVHLKVTSNNLDLNCFVKNFLNFVQSAKVGTKYFLRSMWSCAYISIRSSENTASTRAFLAWFWEWSRKICITRRIKISSHFGPF